VGSGPPPSPQTGRRAELADFLRSRRAAVRPETIGIDAGSRRRTPGLRREEVAARAAVGLSWYTWLEQGRAITPSVQVLEALSRALLLSPAEREHLFLLAGVAVPITPQSVGGPLDDDTIAMLAGLAPHPAYVLDPRFDVLAHNRPAELILNDLLARPPARRNLLRWLFEDEQDWAGLESAWRATARANLLDFRRAYAGREHEPAFAELVDDLTSSSAAFRSWWAGHDVNALEPALKEMRHPRFGILRLRQLQSRLEHRPELRLRVLVPDDDATRRTLVAATQTCGLIGSGGGDGTGGGGSGTGPGLGSGAGTGPGSGDGRSGAGSGPGVGGTGGGVGGNGGVGSGTG